jgi:hypothetical protein
MRFTPACFRASTINSATILAISSLLGADR